jgi:hypothetical protein
MVVRGRRGSSSDCGLLVLTGLVLSFAACTRDNPAFKESSSRGESSESSTSSSESSTGTTDASSTSTSEESGSGVDPLCEDFPPPYPIVTYFKNVTNTLQLECSTYHGNYFFVGGSTETELLLAGPCDEGCQNCSPNELAFGLEPSGMSETTEDNAQCVYIAAEGAAPNPSLDPSHCYFNRVSFWASPGPEQPLLVVSTDGVVPDALAQVAGPNGAPFSVSISKDTQCTCDAVAWCCEDANPPTTYKLNPSGSGEWAYPSDTIEFMWGDLAFEFLNAQSHNSGECDVPSSITWVAQMQDPATGP